MVKDVWPYLTVGLLLTAALAAAGLPSLTVAVGALTIGVASFFRDPRRQVNADPRRILSAADGKVVNIVGEAKGFPPGTRCVSIFLSVFNVHVNRSPVAGRVSDIAYRPGSFLPAFREKASDLNEQNLITLETERGPMGMKQIAGLIARRIRCWKKPGDLVQQGERIGFITFGSRVDLFIPPAAALKVAVGDKVWGGTTIVAEYPEDA